MNAFANFDKDLGRLYKLNCANEIAKISVQTEPFIKSLQSIAIYPLQTQFLSPNFQIKPC
ncbi:hypothetical protein B0181_06285 [Moraxella caviae]|uniref:Uncharacterized protein n=1 Tax=Moraxella caviae TaxID=34060 RepID=A0A1T0A1P7_9GAMM|nr:hypothetical protein B0181_06285 [Moraxella caviae]